MKENMFRYYFDKMLGQLAIDFNSEPDALRQKENIITMPALNEGRRWYHADKPFFQMVTTGGNAVITADERLHGFLRDFIRGRTGHWLFEFHNMIKIEEELIKYGYTLSQTHHMFLPCRDIGAEETIPVRWFFDSEIMQFYGDKRFPNAICEKYLSERPDRIVVCAYDGDKIMGMAGCSEDSPGWQQIGIDVMPEYRSRGVGTYLVTLLKERIERGGDSPFYGTSLSNYHSWNIALNSGFRPAWVEIESRPCGENS